MLASSRRIYLREYLHHNFNVTLENISRGNGDLVADLLAAALLRSEQINHSIIEQSHLENVTQRAVELLQTNAEMTIDDLTQPHLSIAIQTYRDHVVIGLGGRQTLRIENASQQTSDPVTNADNPWVVRWILIVRRLAEKCSPKSLFLLLKSMISIGASNGKD